MTRNTVVQSALTNEHCWTARNDDTTVGGAVAHVGGRHVADENGRAAGQDDVRRAGASALVGGPRGRHVPNQNRRATGWQDRPTDVGHWPGEHRAGVHVGRACGRFAHTSSYGIGTPDLSHDQNRTRNSNRNCDPKLLLPVMPNDEPTPKSY